MTPEDIEDAFLEAALEASLGGRAGPDLTKRILEAAHSQQHRPSAKKRRKRPAKPSPLLPILGILILTTIFIALVANQPSPPIPKAIPKTNKPKPIKPSTPTTPPTIEKVQEPDKAPVERPDTPKHQPEIPKPKIELPKSPKEQTPPSPLPDPRHIAKAPKTSPNPVEKTHVEDQPVILASVLSHRGRVTMQSPGSKTWIKLEKDQEITAGTKLRTLSGSATLALKQGGTLRFDGRISIESEAGRATVTLEKKSLYLDNSESSEPWTLSCKNQSFDLDQGTLLAQQSSSKLFLCCLEGSVRYGQGSLEARQSAEFSRRKKPKLAKISPAKLLERFKLLRSLPDHEIWRQDFSSAPKELSAGTVEKGRALARGPKSSIELDFSPHQIFKNGLFIRVHFRAIGTRSLYIQVWDPVEKKNYRANLSPSKTRFSSLDIPLSTLKVFKSIKTLPLGAELANIQFHLEGSKDSKLEIDHISLMKNTLRY